MDILRQWTHFFFGEEASHMSHSFATLYLQHAIHLHVLKGI